MAYQLVYVISFNITCFKIFAINLNSYIILLRSLMSEVNQIVKLSQSRAFSKQTAITLFRSFLVVDKNVKLFTIFFSH